MPLRVFSSSQITSSEADWDKNSALAVYPHHPISLREPPIPTFFSIEMSYIHLYVH
jgi:hypothetical protein